MTTMITAEQAARALVAACRITGVDPNRVFDKGTARAGQRGSVTGPYGARVMAAMGARSRLGLSPGRLAVVFRVVSADLTPSSGVKRGITAEHLLSVAEAMNGGDMPDRGEVIDLEPEPPEPSGAWPVAAVDDDGVAMGVRLRGGKVLAADRVSCRAEAYGFRRASHAEGAFERLAYRTWPSAEAALADFGGPC